VEAQGQEVDRIVVRQVESVAEAALRLAKAGDSEEVVVMEGGANLKKMKAKLCRMSMLSPFLSRAHSDLTSTE
jgi:hypothetical protein